MADELAGDLAALMAPYQKEKIFVVTDVHTH